MTMLFVNGSPNKDGNTAALAKALFGGKDYETLNLTDYRIGLFGQEVDGDQFHEVIGRIREADVVALGSPMYWHNLCASVRTMMERCYGDDYAADLGGKLVLLFQGGAPEQWMLEAGEYTVKRFAALQHMEYLGMATTAAEARTLGASL